MKENDKKIIFDIDGTLAQSYDLDTDSYNQTLSAYLNRSLDGFDWHHFTHVTDSGITQDLIKQTFNRIPKTGELEEIEEKFAQNFVAMMADRGRVTATNGALNLIQKLENIDNINIGVATGSWRKLAKIKLDSIGLGKLYSRTLTSSEGIERETILQKAIDQFQGDGDVWYFGDGVWDQRTCENLKINFIGVGPKLKNADLKFWIEDFTDLNYILSIFKLS